jgi:general secretion pathway protein D
MQVRIPLQLGVLALLATCAWAADTGKKVPIFCASSVRNSVECDVPKPDLKAARAAFQRGLKLQRDRRLEEALEQFQTASTLVPRDIDYATAREATRQQLVFEHMQAGNDALLAGKEIEAMAEFRGALKLDPENHFAQQRMVEALGETAPKTSTATEVVADSGEIQVQPSPQLADFHFRGDSRDLLTQVSKVFGVTATIDESVVSRRVSFNIQDVDFATAMQAAGAVTKTFWAPVAEKQVLVANNTPENHRQFDRMGARTFRVSTSTPQELNDITNALRALFDIRFLSATPNANTITLRAPQNILDAATRLLQSLDSSRPQVMLDIRLYQVSHTLTRNFGLHIPNQFKMFNIPAGALAALGGQNIQDLVNQLISGGGINQANSTAISALLAQLQSQQNSIFSQPLATFGGGKTFFGVSLDQFTATLQMNESSVQGLQHAILRAGEGQESTFRVGSRYPILNASFAPVFNSPAISRVIGNQSFTAPFPSFSYEDLGFSLKAKPAVHGLSDITLALDLEVRSLGGTSLNGVPVLNNRQYKGTITVKEGEPAVVTGAISHTEQRSLSGIPGFGQVPLLNKVTASNSQEDREDELLLVITPHIVNGQPGGEGPEIWLGK